MLIVYIVLYLKYNHELIVHQPREQNKQPKDMAIHYGDVTQHERHDVSNRWLLA